MSMANPKKSDVRRHETYPGTGPNGGRSRQGTEETSGLRPVEQMVDAAIDRLAREYQATGVVHTEALAVRAPMPGAAGRLRWKGIDVTDEFREYAERVARGEDLPPYTGKVLAEPHPSFPWEPGAQRKASRRASGVQAALWVSALTIAGLIVWVVAGKFSAPQPSASAPLAQPAPAMRVQVARREPANVAPASAVVPGSEAAPNPGATSAVTSATASAQPAPAPPRNNPFRAPTRPASYAAPSAITQTSALAPASDPAPPGSLRAALGELLTAQAAPSELSPTSTPSTPVQSATHNASAAPIKSASAGPVGKEPGDTASGKGSMLVETPSF